MNDTCDILFMVWKSNGDGCVCKIARLFCAQYILIEFDAEHTQDMYKY